MDPLRLRLASPTIRRGLRLLVPDSIRGLVENSALLSTLADQADFLFVAGTSTAVIPSKELALLKTMIDRSNGFLAIYTNAQEMVVPATPVWSQSLGASLLPPIYIGTPQQQGRASETLNQLTGENSGLRLTMLEVRRRIQVENALLLVDDHFVRQTGQLRNRKRLMLGGLVNRPDEDQKLRTIAEELRIRLQDDMDSLRRKIEEMGKIALLNEGAAYQLLKQTIEALNSADMKQAVKGNVIQLSPTEEAVGKLRIVLTELGHQRLNEDLRLVHETLDNTNEELSRCLGEALGSKGRLQIEVPDHRKFWESVVALARPELRYKGELPQVTFMDRLNEARQPLMLVMMSVMLFGGVATMMGGAHGKEKLQNVAGILLLPVFIAGLVWTFVSFKEKQEHLINREMEKLRDGIFQELRKVLADLLREEQGLLNQFFQQTSRNWGQQIQQQIQQSELLRRKATDSQKQQVADQSRSIDDRIRQLEAQRGEAQNLIRNLDRVRLDLVAKISEISRQTNPTASTLKV
jgi:uncharacterized protein YdcH (DUF465 family)